MSLFVEKPASAVTPPTTPSKKANKGPSDRLLTPTAAMINYRNKLAEDRAMDVDPKDDIWWSKRSPKNELLNKQGKQFEHVESKLSEPTYASIINMFSKEEAEAPKPVLVKPITEGSRLLDNTTSKSMKVKGVDGVSTPSSPLSPTGIKTPRERKLSIDTTGSRHRADSVALSLSPGGRANRSDSIASVPVPYSTLNMQKGYKMSPKSPENPSSPTSATHVKPINLNSRLLQTTTSTHHSKWSKNAQSNDAVKSKTKHRVREESHDDHDHELDHSEVDDSEEVNLVPEATHVDDLLSY